MRTITIFISSVLFVLGCSHHAKPKTDEIKNTAPVTIMHPELKKHFDTAGVGGTFLVLDESKNTYHAIDSLPFHYFINAASTFKIPNSLISLECGSVKDEHEIMKWDGVTRSNPKWNADTDMENAFRNSTVWFYRELARRNGGKRMKEYLDKMNYGNADTSGGIDIFWLKGGLRISPEQQISFLKKLKHDSLPFSKRNLDIVKRIMIREQGPKFTLRFKTGWADDGKKDFGWMVGYIEKEKDTYYFATVIEAENKSPEKFLQLRENLCREILHQLGIISFHPSPIS